MWTSLKNFQKIWVHLFTFPVEWDPIKRQTIYNPPSTKLLSYYVSVFGILLSGFLACFTLLCSQLFGFISMPFLDLVMAIVLVFACGAGILGELLCIAFGEDFVFAYNCLLQVEREMVSGK